MDDGIASGTDVSLPRLPPSSAGCPVAAPPVRRLPIGTVNRIAAGEVIERPASVVRELIDNALDAGARRVRIEIESGGMARIRVADDGHGMGADDLQLSVERHATSKLDPGPEPDLTDIGTLGFRGEALPSIGAVSRLRIVSRTRDEAEARAIEVEAGLVRSPGPAAWSERSQNGTAVDVRDLFYATPARLKFLKSERAEAAAVGDAVRALAMARPATGFALAHNGRTVLALDPEPDMNGPLRRLAAILGEDFADNAMAIDQNRDGIRILGHAGLPTLARGTARHQYLFVNGRPVRDRLLAGVVRAAYRDFIARDRHPIVALRIETAPDLVDVNVHPAKTEVRFRDPGTVRALCIGALRRALADAGHSASTSVASAALDAMRPSGPTPAPFPFRAAGSRMALPPLARPPDSATPRSVPGTAIAGRTDSGEAASGGGAEPTSYPLGAARAQLHATYIVAQTADGIVIVDQHAAHERLVLERMKAQFDRDGVRRQALLIPEVVDLGESAPTLAARATEFLQFGLEIESFGPRSVVVRAVPALFGDIDVKALIIDLADEIAEYGEGLALREKFTEIAGNMACRNSIRAGRRMSGDEMNALLRQMEATPHSGQCNHGRPTYVELKLADIERLFGRR